MFTTWRILSMRSILAALALLLICVGAAKLTGLGGASSPAVAAKADPSPCPGKTVRFDARDFPRAAKIDNELFPLIPGTRSTFDGFANRGGGALPHRVIFTVTDLTKVINGVRSVLVWDQDINDGVLSEAELAFFAQDDDGNVWNLGEYPELYENGQFTGAPDTWFSGVDGAQAGIHMLDEPRIGSRYLQGWSPTIDFLDCARVTAKQREVCDAIKCYHDVLRTDENSPLASATAGQYKLHAPGTGIFQIGALNDPEGETLVLTERVRIGASALAAARRSALKLERHAYKVSEVYQQTPRSARSSED